MTPRAASASERRRPPNARVLPGGFWSRGGWGGRSHATGVDARGGAGARRARRDRGRPTVGKGAPGKDGHRVPILAGVSAIDAPKPQNPKTPYLYKIDKFSPKRKIKLNF